MADFTTTVTDAGVLDASVTLPGLGSVNPWLLAAGGGLLLLVLTSGEGRAYTRSKVGHFRRGTKKTKRKRLAMTEATARKKMEDDFAARRKRMGLDRKS